MHNHNYFVVVPLTFRVSIATLFLKRSSIKFTQLKLTYPIFTLYDACMLINWYLDIVTISNNSVITYLMYHKSDQP